MDVIIIPLLQLAQLAIQIYVWIIIAEVVMSWLVAFGVANTGNPVVYRIGSTLHRLTEPVLGRIRRVMPDLGGIDLSPLVAIFGLYFLELMLARLMFNIA